MAPGGMALTRLHGIPASHEEPRKALARLRQGRSAGIGKGHQDVRVPSSMQGGGRPLVVCHRVVAVDADQLPSLKSLACAVDGPATDNGRTTVRGM